MRLSLREKQTLYHELGQFLRSGVGFPQALEAMLAETPGGASRRLFERLRTAVRRGDTVAEAFAHARPAVGEMELAVIEAAGRGGRLEKAFAYLAGYFENLDRVRGELRRGAAWPLVQLHLGVFVPALPALLSGGVAEYVRQTFGVLAAFYALAGVGLLVGAGWVRAARRVPAAEAALGALPLVGRLRRNLALSRFCAAYEMQLSGGVSVGESLRVAARASRSARLVHTTAAVLPRVRAGEQVGPLLAAAGALPAPLLRAIRLGEETGHLDEELRAWGDRYAQAALENLRALGRWLPKGVYLLVAGFLIYQIFRLFDGYLQNVQRLLDD